MGAGIEKLRNFLLDFKSKIRKNEEPLTAQKSAEFYHENHQPISIASQANYPKNEIDIVRITEHLTPEDRAIISDEPTIYTNLILSQITLPEGYDYVLLPDDNEKYHKIRVNIKKGDHVINPDFATICCRKTLNMRVDFSFEKELLQRKLADLAYFNEYMKFLNTHSADHQITSLIAIKEIIYSLIVIGDVEFKKIGKSPVIPIEPNENGTFDIASLIHCGPNKYFIMERCTDNEQGHFICLYEKKEKVDKTSPLGETKTVINQVIYIDKNGLVTGVEYNKLPNFVRKL